MSLLAPLVLLLSSPIHAGTGVPAVTGALQSEFTQTVVEGVPPALTLWAPEHEVAYYVECSSGKEVLRFETAAVPKGERRLFLLRFEPDRRSADCVISARMANGLSENKPLSLIWTVEAPAADKKKPPAKPAGDEASKAAPPPAESTVIEVPPKVDAPPR